MKYCCDYIFNLYASTINRYTGLFASSLVLILFLLFAGCASDSLRQERETDITLDISDEEFIDLLDVKKIFYALPSPLETAMLLKSSGAVYNEELLNPADNVSRYLTNRSMAVNLGIYTANLSYASLFEQTQTSMQYMDAAKGLADNLGILDAVDSYTMERVEENLGNRDVIIDVVSETFMNSSSFLQENDREPVAVMMFVGGWVEGLYLALNLVDEDDLEDDPLVKRIVDNKLSFEILMLLLEENSYNNDVAGLINEMKKIENIFRKIEIESTPIEVKESGDDSATVLSSQSVSNIDRNLFLQLKFTVTSIRNSFVS